MKSSWGLLKLLRKHVILLPFNLLPVISEGLPGSVALEGQEAKGWCSPWACPLCSLEVSGT